MKGLLLIFFVVFVATTQAACPTCNGETLATYGPTEIGTVGTSKCFVFHAGTPPSVITTYKGCWAFDATGASYTVDDGSVLNTQLESDYSCGDFTVLGLTTACTGSCSGLVGSGLISLPVGREPALRITCTGGTCDFSGAANGINLCWPDATGTTTTTTTTSGTTTSGTTTTDVTTMVPTTTPSQNSTASTVQVGVITFGALLGALLL